MTEEAGKTQGKKRGPPDYSRALIIMKVKNNLQRGTAAAVELGGKPPYASAECDMMVYWASGNAFLRRTAMRHLHS
jgi:hypothetical protein